VDKLPLPQPLLTRSRMDSRRTKSAQARVPKQRPFAQPDYPPLGAQQSSFLTANAPDYGQYPNQNALNPAAGAYAMGRPISASGYRPRERTFSASSADLYAADQHLNPNVHDYANRNAYQSVWNQGITGPPVPPGHPPPNSTAGGQNQSPFLAFPEPQLYRPTSAQAYYNPSNQGIYSANNQINYQTNYQAADPSNQSGYSSYPGFSSSPGSPGYQNPPLSPKSHDSHASHVSRGSQGSYMSQESSGTGPRSPTRSYYGVRQDTITPNTAYSEEYFDRTQYAASVTSFSPERSPSLMEEAISQLR
jgi:hypothetical protein